VTQQRFSRFARLRTGLIGCGVAVAALAVVSCSQQATARAGSAAGGSTEVASASSAGPTGAAGAQGYLGRAERRARVAQIRVLAVGDPLNGCEQRIQRGPGVTRAVAIVGASYTAGVGPDNPALSWAADFARTLRWNAVIYGVPGAGYVRAGTDGLGPMRRMLAAERLPQLTPSLVIVQAGHDDGGVPAPVERRQVARTIDLIRLEAPRARIALITVFSLPTGSASPTLYQADRAVVTAARDADPRVIIMDPLTGHWKFQHADDGLHPTAAGDAWIARKVASILRAHGILAARSTVTGTVICDLSVRAKAVLPHSVVTAQRRYRTASLPHSVVTAQRRYRTAFRRRADPAATACSPHLAQPSR
jgi:lysophospholipase L1-like esterase